MTDYRKEYEKWLASDALNEEEKAAVVKENPLYGQIVCRCETVTEGEIIDAIHRPIVPRSIDGIKRRTRSGMGRCQGGFCTPTILEILAQELGVPMECVTKNGEGSEYLQEVRL